MNIIHTVITTRSAVLLRWRTLLLLTALTSISGPGTSLAADRPSPPYSSAAAPTTGQTCPARTTPLNLMTAGERGFVALSDYVAFRYPARIGLLASTCVSPVRTSRYVLAIESRPHTIAIDPTTFPIDLRDVEFTALPGPKGRR